MYTQKSFHQDTESTTRDWYVVDATDKVVGRLATELATLLRGKNKATFTPSTDMGDFVVVTNADKIKFTGNKLEAKKYYRHSGFRGGLKERTAKEQLERRPELIIYNAVKGMLPKTSLGRQQLTKLKVYATNTHPHEAQNPTKLEL